MEPEYEDEDFYATELMVDSSPLCYEFQGSMDIEEKVEGDPPDQTMIMLEYEIGKMELGDTEEEGESLNESHQTRQMDQIEWFFQIYFSISMYSNQFDFASQRCHF